MPLGLVKGIVELLLVVAGWLRMVVKFYGCSIHCRAIETVI